ncbi:MAG: hypothetical protein ACJ79L_10560, partial [Anaeromyxobacteraceae bacterium]
MARDHVPAGGPRQSRTAPRPARCSRTARRCRTSVEGSSLRTWSQRLAIGIAEIDDQHRQL